jgi:uroporphyrinogen-III synthase
MSSKLQILVTKEIDAHLLSQFQDQFDFDILPLIQTSFIESAQLIEKIHSLISRPIAAILTSQKAVAMLTLHISKPPPWIIYTISGATSNTAAKLFTPEAIKGTASSAERLADIITNNPPSEEIYFFCGNQRLNILPNRLKERNLSFSELVVYRTLPLYQKTSKEYDAIIFFSPSAVSTFFNMNQTAEKTVVFAIGETTAACLSKYCSQPIMVPEKPDQLEILTLLKKYFLSKK